MTSQQMIKRAFGRRLPPLPYTQHSRPTDDESAARIWMGHTYEGSEVQREIEERKH
ncbi:gp48 [Alphaproteobacteria phage PhiJL001]|uniref:Gp48 n=1 Tax=Alphaproteobacteria phage PhiJL001 TaxID=2681607 RepID=Q5DN57_9CAUD|nr:gp48 [Alphaproteobacteria phage PhiJL001]AAT69524.1 gp48 [Alphaproteobacteria phage PhiJL001]